MNLGITVWAGNLQNVVVGLASAHIKKRCAIPRSLDNRLPAHIDDFANVFCGISRRDHALVCANAESLGRTPTAKMQTSVTFEFIRLSLPGVFHKLQNLVVNVIAVRKGTKQRLPRARD